MYYQITVLLRRYRFVEGSVGWAGQFRRLAPGFEPLSQTLAALHYVAFVCLMLSKAVSFATTSS
jgi:hypothetical protein